MYSIEKILVLKMTVRKKIVRVDIRILSEYLRTYLNENQKQENLDVCGSDHEF